jgi:signal peptidase I
MTSPFGSRPERPEHEIQPDAPATPASEAQASAAFKEDDLWASDEEAPSTAAANGAEASEPVTAGVTSVNGGSTIASEATEAIATTADSGETDLYADGVELAGASDVDEDELPGAAGQRFRRVTWEILQTLVLAGLIFLLVRGVAQNFRVEGPSMEPGLQNGQYLLVNKAVYFKIDLKTMSKYVPFISGGNDPSKFLFHSPERGDVIVFRYPKDPSRDFIKRVIGVPGDTVSINNGIVSVDGVALTEHYISSQTSCSQNCDIVVPAHSYFVLGDNRVNSSDSRNWGFVPEDNIIGKAMLSYWPLSDFGGVGNRSIDLGFIDFALP